MRPKFQKRSALKFDGRIIPEAKPSGIVQLTNTNASQMTFRLLHFWYCGFTTMSNHGCCLLKGHKAAWQ